MVKKDTHKQNGGLDVTRRSFLAGAAISAATTIVVPHLTAATPGSSDTYKSFRPGEVWLDTTGKPIQAHGGSVIQVDDQFYWYGENKEFTTGKTDVWTWGVRCYSSTDLYNWKDLGLIIPPDTMTKQSPLSPANFLDRPHITYNKQTRQYVCWIKLMSEGSTQTRTVLLSDSITGPYRIVRQDVRPLGMNAGDFDLAVSSSDNKAYMYFERVHSELICADLNEDYTNFTSYYSTHFSRSGPPFVREAPAYFYRRGKHYLATSGTTGYFPNPSEIAVADTFHGPFQLLGDLHPRDRSKTSFNSQISCIFKHPRKKNLYIACADRWIPSLSGPAFENGEFSKNIQALFEKAFSSPPESLSTSEKDLLQQSVRANTSVARYVWLPLVFDGDLPRIDWRSEWSIDEYS
jgi:hypothetical protein